MITGTLDSLEREDAQALIQKYGGRVTGSVSGKTDYVVQGTDEAGQPFEGSKITKARSLPKCQIVDEDGLLELIRATAPQPAEPEPEPEPEPMAWTVDDTQPEAGSSAAGSGAAGADALPALPKREGADPLWAEKYRPTSMAHLVGNADHVRRLLAWLKTWHAEAAALDAGGNEKAKKGETLFQKAALLSGPPGVGKTSTAKVILAQCGYDVVELNASDTRSEKALKALATDMVGNTSIADFAAGKSHANGDGVPRRMALIMDEVDGMSAGDRGGMQALIAVLKTSKMPVVCICNDRQSPKVKSLVNHCLDLRFRRPSALEVKGALKRVVQAEGYSLDDATLERIAEACNADIRQMLNLLQIWRPHGSGPALSAAGVTSKLTSAFKDVDVGPFDVADKFFKEPRSELDRRLRHYFVDSSMTPLLVQENYLSVPVQPPPQLPPEQHGAWQLHRAMQAADYIASSDVIGGRIMREQEWSLAPLHGALSCVAPGYFMQGNLGRVQFPSWLGRNSTATKRQRLLREATSHMQAQISGSKEEVRQTYVPALRKPLLRPLLDRGADGAVEVIELLDAYGLSKDDFDAIMELELLVGPSAKAAIAAVPANAKAALTRKYNAAHAAMKKVGSSKGGGDGGALARFTDEGVDEDGGGADDDEDADEDAEAFVAKKAKAEAPKPKGKGKAKAKA